MRNRVCLLLLLAACHGRHAAVAPDTPPDEAPHARSVTYDERVLGASVGPRMPLAVSLAIGELRDALWIDGVLFAASSTGLVVFPDVLDEARAPLVLGPRDGLASTNVTSLARVGNELWVGTDRGISRVGPRTRIVLGGLLLGERVHRVLTDGTAVTPRGLVRARDGAVLVAQTDAHVAVRCGERVLIGDSFGAHDAVRGVRIAGLPPTPLSALRCRGARVLAGTPLGLYEITRNEARRVRAGNITAVDTYGARVFVGTLSTGAYELDGDAIVDEGRAWLVAAEHDALATFVDRTLFVRRGARILSRSLDGPRGLITALAHTGDRAWVGTFDDGLYELAGGHFTAHALVDPRVESIAMVDDEPWVGTASGLVRGDGTPIVDPRGWLRRYIGAVRVDGERVRVMTFPGFVELSRQGNALTYRSGKADEPGSAPPLFGTAVTGATRVGDRVWLSTLDGLQITSAQRTEVIAAVGGALPDDWINDVLAVGDDVYFLLGDRGFGRVHGNTVTVWRGPLHSTSSTLKQVGPYLAFVASGALFVLRPHGDSVEVNRFDGTSGVPFSVSALDYDADRDRLWLGGQGGVGRLEHAVSFFAAALSDVAFSQPLYSEVP